MSKKSKPFHLVYYVEDSVPMMKKFNSISKLDAFRQKFETNYKGKLMDGWWIDFIVTDIHGKVFKESDLYPKGRE